MTGYIKLHRQILEWEWYSDINTKILFLHILLKANFKDMVWRGININRGQLFTSITHLSSEIGISEKQIRTSLKKLKNTNEIDIQGASNGTMITVCNYETYQSLEILDGEQMASERANEGQAKGERRANEGRQRKKDKKDNKEKKEKNKELPEEKFPAYSECMEIYNNFCLDKIGAKAKIDGVQGNSLKKIIRYLKSNIKENPATDQAICDAFKYLLTKYDYWGDFHKKQLKLNQIESNLINIIKEIKNGGSNRKCSDADIVKLAAEKFGISDGD